MADSTGDQPIAPRRSLGGPILPPPPPEMVADQKAARQAEADRTAAREAEARRQAEKETRQAERDARKSANQQAAAERQRQREAARAAKTQRETTSTATATATRPAARPATTPADSGRPRSAPRRTRRAQLRLVQVDAWSVMKTAFLLSIALGIVLVVAVAIIWSVLGAAGVWSSINEIVQQAVGTQSGPAFDIEDYVGASRVLGFTMIVAVVDVILITAMATLAAFLYNLSAALLGGIEVTLAEDS